MPIARASQNHWSPAKHVTLQFYTRTASIYLALVVKVNNLPKPKKKKQTLGQEAREGREKERKREREKENVKSRKQEKDAMSQKGKGKPSKFEFYELVTIQSDNPVAQEVNGKQGAVLGMAQNFGESEKSKGRGHNEWDYAVYLFDTDETWTLSEQDLVSTGIVG